MKTHKKASHFIKLNHRLQETTSVFQYFSIPNHADRIMQNNLHFALDK